MFRLWFKTKHLCFVALWVLLLLPSACREARQVELSGATIVISRRAGEGVRFAATELRAYLRKVTDREVSIAEDDRQINGTMIWVGPSRYTADMDTTNLRPGGFVIKTTDGNLALIGGDDEGTQFAVYEFLERLGIRWYWPGELGEVVPKTVAPAVGPLAIVENPDFAWRDRGPGGALWGATSGPTEMHARELLLGITEEHQAEVRLWEKRNKWGGLKIYGGHSLGEIFPPAKFASTHPEYYALVNGKRAVPGEDYDYKHGGQVCTTNPEVVQVAVKWTRDFFSRNPDYDGVHLTVNDGGGFCECSRCRALDSASVLGRPGLEVDEMRKTAHRTVITDRIYTFVNQVAEEIQKTHPGKLVFSMAYSRYINPPEKIRLHPQVVPQYCLWSAHKHANTEFRNQHRAIAAGWARAANRKGIYEYDINGSWPGMHRLVMSHIADSIRYLHSLGYDLYQTQSGDEFAINGMNYYVAGKLLWNSDLDEKQILGDFYRNAFRGAGPEIQRYHELLQQAWDDATREGQDITCSSLETTQLLKLFTPELMQQCGQALDEAERLADDDVIRKRVEFYKKGFQYTKLTVEAVRSAKKLYAAGIDIMKPTKAQARIAKMPQAESQALTRSCLSAWEERARYVESLKNDYVLAYFWITYNDTTRDFNPLENLREISGVSHPRNNKLTQTGPSHNRRVAYVKPGEGS
ncbi:MAG: DUF4838 domain-containing protein [Acidobacteriota bacterium]